MQSEKIVYLIESQLPHAKVYVEGDGIHFTGRVICPAFEGQSRIKRQQLVYDTVKSELLDGSLHALSLITHTPDEWLKLTNEQSDT